MARGNEIVQVVEERLEKLEIEEIMLTGREYKIMTEEYEEIVKETEELRSSMIKIFNKYKGNPYFAEELKQLTEQRRLVEEQIEKLQGEKAKLITDFIQIAREIAIKYKRNKYCCVCQKPSTIMCCLHTSYCGPECQMIHADEHWRNCRANQQPAHRRDG